ncbi:MAG TPA: hypothetical protein VE224_00575 [Pseudolabrys sp.]|nr:hypothetical protein [Pseudolabrys sp.]
MTDALQRRQHFRDHGAPIVQRCANSGFLGIERLEPLLRVGDLFFQPAQFAGGVDQALVELAAVGTELLDLPLERGLVVGRLVLLLAQLIEFLMTLLQSIAGAGGVVLRLRRLRLCARQPAERDRQGESEPRDQREARIKTIEPPEANHCVQVTPVVWVDKGYVIRR